MGVLSVAVSFVVFPLAVVDIAVSVDKSSSAIGLVISPVPFVDATIAPYLVASSVSEIGGHIPLSLVLGSIRQYHHLAVLLPHSWLVLLIPPLAVHKLRKFFSDLNDSGLLFLQLLGIHFNMDCSSHQQPLGHLEAIYFLDHLPGQEASDHGLHSDDGLNGKTIDLLATVLLSALSLDLGPLLEVSFLILLRFVRAAISHL
jgi:hypothetical protein